MPSNNSLANRLPKSFLEALEEAAANPLSFVRKNGSVAYLPFVGGGAPDDNGEGGDGQGGQNDGGDGSEGAGSGTDTGAGTEGSGTGDTGDDGDGAGDDEDEQGDLPENVKAILRKNRKAARDAEKAAANAVREANAAKAKAKEYEDRDKTALQKAEEERDEARKRADALEDSNKVLGLRMAFLADTSVTWVEPEDALDMALMKYGLKELEVSDTGKVDKKALKAIIKTLSSEKGYLVQKDGQKDGPQGASGGSLNSGKGGKKPDTGADVRRFPAMAGRRKVT
jgi:hypothetical protein